MDASNPWGSVTTPSSLELALLNPAPPVSGLASPQSYTEHAEKIRFRVLRVFRGQSCLNPCLQLRRPGLYAVKLQGSDPSLRCDLCLPSLACLAFFRHIDPGGVYRRHANAASPLRPYALFCGQPPGVGAFPTKAILPLRGTKGLAR